MSNDTTVDRTPRGSCVRARERAHARAVAGMKNLARGLDGLADSLRADAHAEDDHSTLSQAMGDVLHRLALLTRAQGAVDAFDLETTT